MTKHALLLSLLALCPVMCEPPDGEFMCDSGDGIPMPCQDPKPEAPKAPTDGQQNPRQ